jgi:hypothetical protein
MTAHIAKNPAEAGFFASIYGARGGTRTPTPLPASGPKPGASTNFATCAVQYSILARFPRFVYDVAYVCIQYPH